MAEAARTMLTKGTSLVAKGVRGLPELSRWCTVLVAGNLRPELARLVARRTYDRTKIFHFIINLARLWEREMWDRHGSVYIIRSYLERAYLIVKSLWIDTHREIMYFIFHKIQNKHHNTNLRLIQRHVHG